MNNEKLEWGKEIVQAVSDAAELAQHASIPGIGLLAKFIQHFYDVALQKRFERFILEAEVDSELIEKISTDETYSNCFYAILETVRQTHSKIGLTALAYIYKDHWNDEAYLIAATQAFTQISDKTIDAFISLFESIPTDKSYLSLAVAKEDGLHFHELYNEAVELIRRNFFVMSTYGTFHANASVQGMKWDHTDSYYAYCQAAKIVSNFVVHPEQAMNPLNRPLLPVELI